jgi:hypothetical protein
MLALGSLLEKSRVEDKETQQLRAKIAGDQRTLRALLQQRLRHAYVSPHSLQIKWDKAKLITTFEYSKNERTRRGDDIANIISSAFVAPTSNPNCPSYPGTAIAINPIFASATEMITTSHVLVREYDNIEEMVAKAAEDDRKPITDTWQQDVEEMKRLLDLGYRKALRDVKKVLGVNGAEEMTERDKDDGGRLTKMEPNHGLSDTLRYAERGVKRMVKGLPRNIEMGWREGL